MTSVRLAAPTTLSGQASARAAADTAAVVAGLKAQQDAALQQALVRAQQQGALGLGASKYLEGLHIPERTASDFSNAAAAQVAAAQGFQGGLQQTIGDAAQAVQHNLDVMGGGQTATNQSQAAGNALYALGGYLPSAQLGVVGPALAAGQRALPAQTLGFGQMLAMGELGAGQQEAAKFSPEITAAYAKQGPLAATYLDSLNEAAATAAKARQDAAYREATLRQNAAIAQARLDQSADIANQRASAPKIFGSAGSGYYMVTPKGIQQITDPVVSQGASGDHYYQDAAGNDYVRGADGSIQMLPGQAKAPTPATPVVRSIGNGGLVRVNPNGSVDTLREPDPSTASTPRVQIIGSDARGRSYINSKGNLVPFKGPLGKPLVKPGPQTTGFSNTDVRMLAGDIVKWEAGDPGTDTQPAVLPKPYNVALRDAILRGPGNKAWQAKATKLVNARYGTPQKIARDQAVAAKAQGESLVGAVKLVLASSAEGTADLPPQAYINALASIYNWTPAAVAKIMRIYMNPNG